MALICRPKKNAGVKLFIGLPLLLCAYSAQGQWLYFTPWAGYAQGNFGLSYYLNKSVNSAAVQSGGVIARIKAQLASKGYVYRPWIIKSDYRVSTQLDHNLYSIVDQNQQTQSNSILRANFQLYPNTYYQTNIALEQGLRLQISDETNRITHTRVAVTNNYQPPAASYKINNQLTWYGETERLGGRQSDRLNLTSNFQQSINDQNSYDISLLGQIQTAGIAPTFATDGNRDISNQYGGVTYGHQWQLSDLGVSSLSASYTSEKVTQGNNSQRNHRAQFSSFTRLNSDDNRRLRYNLIMLANQMKAERTVVAENTAATERTVAAENEIHTVTQQNYNSSASFNFDYSETLRFQGSIDVNQRQSSANKITSFGQIFKSSYSDVKTFDNELRYGWQSNISIRGRQYSGDSAANSAASFVVSPSIAHDIKQDLLLFGQPFNLASSQSLSHNILDRNTAQGADASNQWRLSQRVSISWQHSINAVNSNVLLSFNDSRHLNELPNNDQSIYLTFQRDSQLSSDASWGGNLNYEWRSSTNRHAETITQSYSAGNLWYSEKDIFGVPRLHFRSTLNLPINELLFDNKDRNNNVTSWRNRLDFRMGLLEATAQMDMTPDSYHLSISVKRYFGMPL